MIKRFAFSILALPILAFGAAAQDQLGVGSEAPDLTHVNWLRGNPVSQWQDGQVYVLDFWATWCGPCIRSIPHLVELNEKHGSGGLNIIGVAIWPRKGMVPTAEFIAKREEMRYRICEDIDGATAKAFMDAAGRSGIPTCMVVGKSGKIEWIGHPMVGLDEVVELVLAGKFDGAEFERAQKEKQEKRSAAVQALRAAQGAGNWADVLKACDEIVAVDANMRENVATIRYAAYVKMDRRGEAAAFGLALVAAGIDNAMKLNEIAWFIVDPEGALETPERDLDLALVAAVRAADLTEHKDAAILDTLARTYFWRGDLSKAIEVQRKAAEHATGRMATSIKAVLEEYEKKMK